MSTQQNNSDHVAVPAETSTDTRLEALISNVSNTSFECGAFDMEADTETIDAYRKLNDEARAAKDALRQYVMSAIQKTSLSDAQIEHFALKHIATLFGKIGPGGDYKKTEQFKRIKAYTFDLLAAQDSAAGQNAVKSAGTRAIAGLDVLVDKF